MCNHDIQPLNIVEASDIPGPEIGIINGGLADIMRTTLMTDNGPKAIAVKCFRRPDNVEASQLAEWIREEILIWRVLSNLPHVVGLFGIIPEIERYSNSGYASPCPISAYCEAGPLSLFIPQHNPSTLQRLKLLHGVIRGMMHIHSQSVVHGDLKGSNILIVGTADGYKPEICDFGSSYSNCGDCYHGSRDKIGTVGWMSPERFKDEDVPGTTYSDIWSFGCVALEAQFDKMPYATDQRIVWRKILRGKPPATKETIGYNLEEDGIANFVWNMVQECWEWEPAKRPSAQELLDHFNLAVERYSPGPPPEAGWIPSISATARQVLGFEI